MSSGGFAARLYALRTGAKLSQEELAQAAGVSVRAVSDMERGRSRGPQRRTVQALATALGLDATGARDLESAAALGRPRPRRAARPASPPAGRTATQSTPHHTLGLPRDLADFTARGPALDRLRTLAEHLDPAHPPVAVVCGQPGLGKTAFAVHAAHALAPTSRTGSTPSTCAAWTPSPPLRATHSPGCCAPSASPTAPSPPPPTTAAGSCAPYCASAKHCSSWTTPPTRTRSAPCCPAAAPRSRSSPAATPWPASNRSTAPN